MRRLIMIAAAMTLGGTALAQSTTTTTTSDPQGTTMPDPAPADAGTMQSMQNDPAMAQPTQTDTGQPMQQPMQPGQQPMNSGTMQPGQQPMNSGTMPMQGSNMGNMSGMQPAMAQGEYPRCSRTVTDRCIQVASGRRARR